MKLKKHLKEIIITLSVISLTTIWYAAVTTVSDTDTLTATIWNEMKDIVNSNEAKLTNIYNNSWKIWIWKTIPSRKLDIETNDSHLLRIKNTNVNGASYLWILNDAKNWIIRNNGWDADKFQIRDETLWENRLTIDNSGNAWIWTTSPSQKLEVAWYIKSNWLKIPHGFIIEHDSVATSTSELFIKSNANIEFTIDADNSTSDRSFRIMKDNAVDLFKIQENGNVWIWTSNPTSKLQVVWLLEYADNAAAVAWGLTVWAVYRTWDLLKVVH